MQGEMPIFADMVASEHAKCQGSVSYIFALWLLNLQLLYSWFGTFDHFICRKCNLSMRQCIFSSNFHGFLQQLLQWLIFPVYFSPHLHQGCLSCTTILCLHRHPVPPALLCQDHLRDTQLLPLSIQWGHLVPTILGDQDHHFHQEALVSHQLLSRCR